MGHIDTAYELGVKQAAADFGAWLTSGIDNPTAEPARGYTKTAIDRMIQKLAKPRGGYGPKPCGCTRRNPVGKGTRFKALVKKLKKKKKPPRATKGR